MDHRTDRYDPNLDTPRREVTVYGTAMTSDLLSLSVADLQARVLGRKAGETTHPTLIQFRAITEDEMPFPGEGEQRPVVSERGFYSATYVWF